MIAISNNYVKLLILYTFSYAIPFLIVLLILSGYIESQPDKSTDDQSSDKEHKKKIQRTLSLTDFDEGKHYPYGQNIIMLPQTTYS
jgi:hypothetical protein